MSRTCLNIRIRACCLLSTWVDFPCQRAGVIVHHGDPLSSPVWLHQLNTAMQTHSFTHPQLRVTCRRPVIISCVCASECVSAERPPVVPKVWLTLCDAALLSRVLAGICTGSLQFRVPRSLPRHSEVSVSFCKCVGFACSLFWQCKYPVTVRCFF